MDKSSLLKYYRINWLRKLDLNQRPSGYEPDELPTALFRDINLNKLDGIAGFEPANIGTKNRGLTAWRYPNIILYLFKWCNYSKKKILCQVFL